MKQFTVTPSQQITGEMRVASDKSISHRAVLLSSLAEGETEIVNLLKGEDVLATIRAMRTCGVHISEADDGVLRVCGGGIRSPSDGNIDCGNSGTLMRLFCGVAAGWNIPCHLVGDASLMTRPMRRVTDPLTKMGADIAAGGKGVPPVIVNAGARALQGILHHNRISSAQVKSALLLAGLCATGHTVIAEPVMSRDHTERMLETFGVPIRRSEDLCLTEVARVGKLRTPGRIEVPADISSSMFFIVAAAMAPGSDILLSEVGINRSRTGALDLLRRMGADIDILNRRSLGAEPIADIRVRGGELHGIEIGAVEVPAAIDDFPALFVAAAAARGTTRLRGAGELRYKESDRITAMASGLSTLGVECEEHADGMTIIGRNGARSSFTGGIIEAHGDHRIAMAFCLASLRAKNEIVINDCDNVQTSFPNFVKLASSVGIRIVEQTIEGD